MKKSIVILILCIIQGACAVTDPLTGSHTAHSGNQQIAAEISVRHELPDPTADVETISARNDFAGTRVAR